jgi:hypothetical protein
VVFVEGYDQWAFLDLKRPSSKKNTIKEKHRCIGLLDKHRYITSSPSINHKGIAHFLIYTFILYEAITTKKTKTKTKKNEDLVTLIFGAFFAKKMPPMT